MIEFLKVNNKRVNDKEDPMSSGFIIASPDSSAEAEESPVKYENFLDVIQEWFRLQSELRAMTSSPTSLLDLGVRVVRGPDWTWSDQDGGDGHAGTIIEIGRKGSKSSPAGTVVVQWDSGVKTNYRCGYQDAFDLRVWDNAPAGVRHSNIACAGCAGAGITGIRWTCARCPAVHLCQLCYMNDEHDRTHPFVRFDDAAVAAGVPVGPRAAAAKVPLRGLFPGATVARGPDWDWGNQDGGPGQNGKLVDIEGWNDETGRSVGSVRWNASGNVNVYRVGHKGKIDLKYVKSSVLCHYYPAHLPVLGGPSSVAAPPIPVNTPVFRVGDRVQISVPLEQLQSLCARHGGFNAKMAAIVGKTGHVHRITDKGDMRVDFAEAGQQVRWTVNPAALVKVNSFEPGDVVQVISDAARVQDLQRGHGEWTDSMREALGKTGRIVKCYKDGDIRIAVVGKTWTFNPLCVVRVEPAAQLDCLMESQLELEDFVRLCAQGRLAEVSAAGRPANLKLVRLGLQAAAKGGHLDVVTALDARFPEQTVLRCNGGKTALHVAAFAGRVDVVEYLLGQRPELLEVGDDEGDRPVHYAAFGSQPGVMERLVEAGAEVNARNAKGCTPLQVAVIVKSLECVRVLLSHPDIDPSVTDTFGDTPMHEAIVKDFPAVTELLCASNKVDFRIKNKRGFNCLQYAALKGNLPAVRGIIKRCFQLAEEVKDDGFTPLHLASLNGHWEVVQCLIQEGKCQIDPRDSRGQTPLHMAAGQGFCSIVELLVSHSADVRATDADGNTPLHLAVGREGELRESCPPITFERSPRMLELIQKTSFAGVSALLIYGVTIACYLIDRGADATLQNRLGRTPLDYMYDPAGLELLKDRVGSQIVRDDDSDRVECAVCSEPCRPVIFEPCRHALVCHECCVRMKKCLQCKQPIARKITDGRDVVSSACSSTEHSGGEIEALAARVQDWEDQFLCSICMERRKNVAFLCGHGACSVCVETLRKCHMCRGPINKKINLY